MTWKFKTSLKCIDLSLCGIHPDVTPKVTKLTSYHHFCFKNHVRHTLEHCSIRRGTIINMSICRVESVWESGRYSGIDLLNKLLTGN